MRTATLLTLIIFAIGFTVGCKDVTIPPDPTPAPTPYTAVFVFAAGGYEDVYDATVRSDIPDTNYETAGGLTVGFINVSTEFQTYIKFDITSIPEGSLIQSATLTLDNCTQGGSPGNKLIAIENVSATWSHDTITWNNKPASTASSTYDMLDSGGAGSYDIPLSVSMVQAWFDDENSNHGVVLKKGDALLQTISFNSSNAATNQPVLTVQYY